jgi:hypothetical protein
MTTEPKFKIVAHDCDDMRYLTIHGFGYLSSYKNRPAVIYTESRIALTTDELYRIAHMAMHFDKYWAEITRPEQMPTEQGLSSAELRHEE